MRRKEAIAGSRRSARISALEEKARELALQRRAKQLAASSSPPLPLPAARKRGRKRKSLQSVVVNSVTPHKEGEDPKHEDNATKAEMENLSSSQGMPKKETLEFILDVLQRRDTQEIFAQPVDPQQVADYYNIIKEPMDFGTMRAKLQEGMYTSFEQFERDVFLISSNAMKFNSSTTVYYTEARAISELAERLFRSLRTEPESFQLEYTRTRRRSGKKPQVEVATDANKPSASKHGLPLNHKRVNYQPFAFKPRIGQTNNQFLSRNGRSLLNSSEIEKRMTYLPQNFFRTENDKIISSVYNMPKQLAHAPIACGQYRESLMQFVKDLGPAAQIAANKKLGKYFLQNPYSNQISNPSGSYKGKMVCTNGGLGEDANYSSSKANYNSDLLMASLMQISAVQDKANHTPSGSYYPLTGYENLPVPPPPPPPLPPLPPPSVMVSSSLLYPNGEAGPSNAVPAPAPAPAPAPSWGSPSMLLKGSTHQEMPSFRRMNYVQGEPIEELFWNPQAQQFNFMNGKLQPDLNLQL